MPSLGNEFGRNVPSTSKHSNCFVDGNPGQGNQQQLPGVPHVSNLPFRTWYVTGYLLGRPSCAREEVCVAQF